MPWMRYLMIGLCLIAFELRADEEPIYAPQADMPTPGFNVKEAANFDELRHTILDLVSSGKKRVWLITNYLTDGDIVSALYVAKYRKVDVRVFLGRDRQNAYLSRLNYLKAQKIPVFLRPTHGYTAPTILFIDQRLYTVSRDLNVLNSTSHAVIQQGSPADVKNFVSWFRGIVDYPEPTLERPEPAVTIQRRPKRSWSPEPPVSSTQPAYEGENNGVYNYDRSGASRKAPNGVPTQLPKVPRWQKIQEIREKNAQGTGIPDAEAAGEEPRPNDATPGSNSAVPGPSGPAVIENSNQFKDDFSGSPMEER